MGAALQFRGVPDAAASTASHRAFRDDRDPPLFRVGWRELVEMICPTTKAEYFLRGGWTGNSDLPVEAEQVFGPP
jgi:hypothetical protein